MAQLAADDPQTVGGYRLLSRLGKGGMGNVYLARSAGGRTVAVKLIKPELAAEPEFRSRFRLEVEAARRVGERWTAPVLDADTEAETPWVATGYIAGPSLEQVISSRMQQGHGPLPENSVRTLAYGLASALLDIHGAGVVHRDLKPSNVLVTIDGPRVIDFGIVRALDALPESTMTSTGVVVGSPTYMSPEQIRAQQVSPASDVFCMGSVLAFAATGRPPFGAEGVGGIHAVMYRIAAEEPELEGIQEPLRGLIASCLEKDAADRPAPEDVIAGVQPISTGTAAAPWLPAALIAELGRHAVQLLDTDTPPSGSGAPANVPGPESGRTQVAPSGSENLTSALPRPAAAEAAPPPPAPRRRKGRWISAAVAAVVAAGVGLVATGVLPLFGSDKPGDTHPESSDVPSGYVGIWSGPVLRDGEPTGQHRRFTISSGKVGEVVANSFSLGTDYECKSDAKLVSAGKALDLDTRVIKSVGRKCSALGSHSLTRNSDDTLTWEAAGRTATLKQVPQPEKLPAEFLGTWQRPLNGGGTQRVTVEQIGGSGTMSVRMVSESPTLNCVAKADLFSAGSGNEAVRIGPPDVNEAASSGECSTGPTSTLRVENDRMVRTFAEGDNEVAYTRTE